MIKIVSSSVLLVLVTIAITFLVINLQNNDSKRLQNGSEKWNEENFEEENFDILAKEELYIDIVATLEPAIEVEIDESSAEIDDFDINQNFKGKDHLVMDRSVLVRGCLIGNRA